MAIDVLSNDPRSLTDKQLLSQIEMLVQREREDIAEIVVHLAEADRRELLIDRGYGSLFEYCVKKLGYSEAAAYARIRAARAYLSYPEILGLLRQGDVHLDTLARIFPHMETRGGMALLEQAKGKTSREVMAMVAELSPGPEVADVIKFVGRSSQPPIQDENDLFSQHQAQSEPMATSLSSDTSGLGAENPKSNQPEAILTQLEPRMEVSGPQRVRFAFTADSELLALVERAREVLRHKHPDGRLEKIFKDALVTLLDKRDPDRRLLTALPRPTKRRRRRIPQWVKDQVWRRDGGCCAYLSEEASPESRRCASRDDLEYDHIQPWALGGVSDEPANVRLLCRAHNQFLAKDLFGFAEKSEQANEVSS